MKKTTLFKTMFAILFLFGTLFATNAQLLVENFDYPIGTVLTTAATANATTGWASHSGNGTQNIDVTAGLSFTGYAGSGVGGAANVDNNGQDINKSFALQKAGTVYAAFMVNTGATNNQGYFLHLGPATMSSTFYTRVWVNGTGSALTLTKGSSVTDATWVPITAGTTALVVIKHDFTALSTSFYVLNSFSATEPASANVTFLDTIPTAAETAGIGTIGLRQYHANQRIIVDGIRVANTWALAVAATTGEEPVATPTFTPANTMLPEPTAISISCATEGATIYYTTDGSEPTTSSNVYSAPFTVSKQTTVKAFATKAGKDNSSVNTITYTFPDVAVANIAAFNALSAGTVAKITGTITVVYQNANNLFVQDASGWLLIYGQPGKTYQSGDQLTNVIGRFLMYGTAPANFPELELISGVTLPDGVAGTPATAAVVTPASLTNADLNRYVAFENVEIAANVTYATTGEIEDGTIVNGAGTMIIRNHYNLIGATFNAGDKVNIKGIVRSNSNNIQIYILSIGKVTGIDKPQNNIAKIYPLDGNVIVVSEKAQRVEIYNTLGQKLVSRNVTAGTNTIPVSARGILFVKMGDKTSKILVK